jgi:hypothetical protein
VAIQWDFEITLCFATPAPLLLQVLGLAELYPPLK